MDANNYAMPPQAARHYINLNLNHLPGALRHLGLFFMLVAASFIILNLSQSSSSVSTGDAFTIFSTFILGLWMLMLSFVLHMFPLDPVGAHPLVMKAIHILIFGLRIDLLF